MSDRDRHRTGPDIAWGQNISFYSETFHRECRPGDNKPNIGCIVVNHVDLAATIDQSIIQAYEQARAAALRNDAPQTAADISRLIEDYSRRRDAWPTIPSGIPPQHADLLTPGQRLNRDRHAADWERYNAKTPVAAEECEMLQRPSGDGISGLKVKVPT